jgi:CDP-glucose 4,6-dehydratase
LKELAGARVFLTGHTGFKGSWTLAILRALGARVTGYSLPAPTTPSLFEESGIREHLEHVEGDVRDLPRLTEAMRDCAPDLVVHMAAQSLVLEGMADPIGTYSTNVVGTANVLEGLRSARSVRAAIIVTSDKCYEPSVEPLREDDRLGGHDPYAASKACAEIVVDGYRALLATSDAVVATVRAGNVIGGGDWSANRLIPDLARAMLGDRRIVLRYPRAIRPWQHVFDAVSGYLQVAARALEGDAGVGKAWNFGPNPAEHLDVEGVVKRFSRSYGSDLDVMVEPQSLPENPALRLDSELARRELGWAPLFDVEAGIEATAAFYRRRAEGEAVGPLLTRQIDSMLERAHASGGAL